MALILCLNLKKKREIKMDNKNVFVALALSMSVLLFWAAFLKNQELQTIKLSKKKTELKIYYSIFNESNSNKKNHKRAINKNSKRVKIENNNIVGSLLLKGGLIDDISFKKS